MSKSKKSKDRRSRKPAIIVGALAACYIANVIRVKRTMTAAEWVAWRERVRSRRARGRQS